MSVRIRLQKRDSDKHAKTCIYERAYETPKYGILILSTLKHAYIS